MITDLKIYTFLPILQLFYMVDLVIFVSAPTDVDFIIKHPLYSCAYEL